MWVIGENAIREISARALYQTRELVHDTVLCLPTINEPVQLYCIYTDMYSLPRTTITRS